MSTAKERVIEERAALLRKTDDLSAFLRHSMFSELGALQQSLLVQQLCHMSGYALTLSARLDHWDEIK